MAGATASTRQSETSALQGRTFACRAERLHSTKTAAPSRALKPTFLSFSSLESTFGELQNVFSACIYRLGRPHAHGHVPGVCSLNEVGGNKRRLTPTTAPSRV